MWTDNVQAEVLEIFAEAARRVHNELPRGVRRIAHQAGWKGGYKGGLICKRGHSLAEHGFSDKNGHKRCLACRKVVDSARRSHGNGPRSRAEVTSHHG